MKAAYFTGLRQLEIHEQPPPRLRGPNEVLVRIDRVGVCGSDVHYYLHGRIGDQIVEYPATVGHECAATVVEAGTAVVGLRPGTRVAVDPALVCGHCDQCRAGRVNTCRQLRFLGCPGEAPGAAAEYHVLPAENCVAIPEEMTLDQAALIEPISIGLYATRLGEVDRRARIGVLGCGPIGLSVILCTKVYSQATIYATDLLQERLEVARRCGADWTGCAGQEDVVRAITRLEPEGLDVVFECAGDPQCIDQAQQLLAPGSALLMVGIPRVAQVPLDVHCMRRKELTLKNVRRQNGCIVPAIELVSRGRIDADLLLTHRFPLARIRDAFELVAGYRDGVIKALIDVSSAP